MMEQRDYEREALEQKEAETTFDFSKELNRQGALYNLAFGSTSRGVFEKMKPGESVSFALPGGKAINITKKNEREFVSPDYLQYLKDEAPAEAFMSEALKSAPGGATAFAAASGVTPGFRAAGETIQRFPVPLAKPAGAAVKYIGPMAVGLGAAIAERLLQERAVESVAPEMIRDIYEGGERAATLSPGTAALGAAASQLPVVGPGIMPGTGMLTNVISGTIGGGLDVAGQIATGQDVDVGRSLGVAAINTVLGKPTTLGKKVAPNLANQGALVAKQSKETGNTDLQAKLNQTQPVQVPPPEIAPAAPAQPEIVPAPSRTPLVPYERTTEIPRELEIMDIVRRDLDDASINAGLEAAKRNELAIEAERRAKYLSDAAKTRGVRYQYSVFQFGDGRPPLVQVDAIAPDGSASLASGSIDEFRAVGAKLPDVPEDIPQGRYTTEQVEGFVKPAAVSKGWTAVKEGMPKEQGGFGSTPVMLDIASAGAGGLGGSFIGDTPEERTRNAMIGAAMLGGASLGMTAPARLSGIAAPSAKSPAMKAVDNWEGFGYNLPLRLAKILTGERGSVGIEPDAQGFIPEKSFNNLVKRLGISDSEMELFRTLGFDEKKFSSGGRMNLVDAVRWMNERAPRIEVLPLEVSADEASSAFYSKTHEMETRGWNLTHLGEFREIESPDGGLIYRLDLENKRVLLADEYDAPDAVVLKPEEVPQDVARLMELSQRKSVADWYNSDAATGRYGVEPKELKDMPGAVDILVRLPVTTSDPNPNHQPKGTTGVLYRGPHFGDSDKNVLASVRGYVETLPSGERVFHVFEVQSDWGQLVGKLKERAEQGISSYTGKSPQNHPLLAVYEQLALKSAINHARKLGIKKIAISDAETAMMTEGHDKYGQAGHMRIDHPNSDGSGDRSYRVINTRTGEERVFDTYEKARDYTDTQMEIPQESGMRAAYDKRLPSIAQKLTGDTGRIVDFGKHKTARPASPGSNLLVGSDMFNNKTNVTARVFDISGSPKKMAAFGYGERGAISPGVMLDIASGTAGAGVGGAVGYATGDTPEEKARRAAAGAAIGLGLAGGGSALSRMKRGAAPATQSKDVAALDSMMKPDEKAAKPIGERISEAINRARTAMNTSRGWIGYAQRELTGKMPGPGQNLERAAEQLAGSPVRAQYAVEPLFKTVEDLTPDDVHNLNRLILAKRIEARLSKIPEDLAKVQDAVGRAQAEFDIADEAWKQGKSLEAASARSKAKKNLDEAIEDLNEFRSTKEVAGWELDPSTTKNNPAKAIADLEAEIGPERAAILNRKLAEYSEQMRGVLDSRVESGLLSPESARQIAESADFYAPFKVLRYFDEQKGAYTDGRSTFTQGRLIRKLTGMREEDTKIADVLTASAEQLYRNSIQNDKNRFMRRLATLTRLDKEGKWIKPINEGDKLPDGFETVPYFVRGERRLLGVDKKLMESLSAASGTLMDEHEIIKALGMFSSAFKAGATTLSIPFLIANATIRDPLRLSIISKAGVKNPKDFATLALVDYPMAFIDSLSTVLGRPTRMGEVWLSSGAANATFSRSLTPTAFKSKIPRERSLLDIAMETHFGIKPATTAALSVGNVFEQLPKIAGMRRMMREAGIVPPQTVVVRKGGAAQPGDITPPPFRGMASNVMTGEGAVQNQRQWEDMVTEVRNYAGSPDFQRFGSKMAILNVLMPFSNARWQGISQDAARLAALNTPEGRAAAARLFGAIAVPAATLAWWNMQPENEDDYNRLSPRDKQNKFNIPLYEAADGSGTPFPFRKNPDGSYAENKPLYYVTKQGEKMRRYFSVPRYEAPALAANAMESFVKFTKDTDPEAFSKLGDVFISGALPITVSGDTPEQRALSTISGLNPMLRVPLEQAFNTAAYTGKDIVPDWKKGAHPVDQFDPNYTPQAYRRLAEGIAEETGLTGQSLAGQLFTSPARLQHMAEGFTGGLTKSFTTMPGEEGTSPIASRLEKMWRPSEFSDATEERKAARLAMADKTSEASRRNEAVVDVLRSARKELVAAMRSNNELSADESNAILTTTSIPMVQKFVDDGLLNRDDVRKIERGLMDLANGMTPVEAFVKNNVDSKARPAYYVRLIKSGVVKDPYAYLSRELQIGNLTSEIFPLLSQELDKAGITIEPTKENNP